MLDLNDLKYNQHQARQMREIHGVEMTPDEVYECRKSALRKIREHLWDLNPPEDDVELIKWFYRLASGKPR